MRFHSIAAAAAVALFVSPLAAALERPAAQPEIEAFKSSLGSDVRMQRIFELRDVVASLDFEAGSSRAVLCGQVAPPADRP